MAREAQLRLLPGLDRLLQSPALAASVADSGRALTVSAARETLEHVREAIRAGSQCPPQAELEGMILEHLSRIARRTLGPVVNATGVIIHTNLGRAPLSLSARLAMDEVGAGYCDLEYDLEVGGRGTRYGHARHTLCRLTGAESALVVNNNAGALLLILAALAADREVVVSRGQLVEIGGGFRVSEVMAQSGARMVEVGTTNRTHLRDFEAAISPATALVVAVHRSNFQISGFTQEPALIDLVRLGEMRGVMVVNDLGSGTLLDTSEFGLAAEPTIQESVSVGAALTTFSGDKLLGGPQAGIIVGRREAIDRIGRHPLTRALRVDKTTLAALEATLLHYLREEAIREIPVWRMIAATAESIRIRAEGWLQRLRQGDIAALLLKGRSAVGGGALPGQSLDTWLVAIEARAVDQFATLLRGLEPPVIGRIEGGRLLLDPRTVLPEQDQHLLDGISRSWAKLGEPR